MLLNYQTQIAKFIACLKMSANDETKKSTYYAITSLECHNGVP